MTLLDQDLWRFEEVWAAAGHPHGVFRLRPQDLPDLTQASPADVVQGSRDDRAQESPVHLSMTKVAL